MRLETRVRAVGLSLLLASLGFGADPPPLTDTSPATETESVLFGDLPMVEAAWLHAQTLQEAPANVTMITAEEIRTYGYRTFGEALSNVRGFYVTDDFAYTNAGLRGFSLPGDYSTRILFMINGHYITDNIYSSGGFMEQDFGLDMDLVERIEVIRGPSSALYGSNGVFATVNVVTRAPVDQAALSVTNEIGSHGQKKLGVTSSSYLGKGANLLFSLSSFHYGGQEIFFPSQDSPETNFGIAEGVNRERGYHGFANLTSGDWSFTGMLSSRETRVPTGWYGTIFNTSGNKIRDGYGFAEAAYSHDFSDGGSLKWRVHYDRYRYWGRYDYDYDVGIVEDNQDISFGQWVGSRAAYSFKPNRLGTLTVGGQFSADIEALQQNFDVQPEFFEYSNSNFPNRSYGVFAQQELAISEKLTAYLGARFDDSKLHKPFASPRLALIYQHSPKTTFKLLYGRAFRNPNAFEQFYGADVFNAPNPNLGPEKISTLETTVEHRIGSRIDVVATVYRYWLGDLIEGVEIEEGLFQFNNSSNLRAWGGEFGLRGKPVDWLQLAGSVSAQRLTDMGFGLSGVNSPGRMAKFRFSLPLAGKFRVAGAARYLTSRKTFAGNTVRPVYLADLTVSTVSLHPTFDLLFGVRNLFDRRHFEPVGPENINDRFPRVGRTAFVKLIWTTGE